MPQEKITHDVKMIFELFIDELTHAPVGGVYFVEYERGDKIKGRTKLIEIVEQTRKSAKISFSESFHCTLQKKNDHMYKAKPLLVRVVDNFDKSIISEVTYNLATNVFHEAFSIKKFKTKADDSDISLSFSIRGKSEEATKKEEERKQAEEKAQREEGERVETEERQELHSEEEEERRQLQHEELEEEEEILSVQEPPRDEAEEQNQEHEREQSSAPPQEQQEEQEEQVAAKPRGTDEPEQEQHQEQEQQEAEQEHQKQEQEAEQEHQKQEQEAEQKQKAKAAAAASRETTLTSVDGEKELPKEKITHNAKMMFELLVEELTDAPVGSVYYVEFDRGDKMKGKTMPIEINEENRACAKISFSTTFACTLQKKNNSSYKEKILILRVIDDSDDNKICVAHVKYNLASNIYNEVFEPKRFKTSASDCDISLAFSISGKSTDVIKREEKEAEDLKLAEEKAKREQEEEEERRQQQSAEEERRQQREEEAEKRCQLLVEEEDERRQQEQQQQHEESQVPKRPDHEEESEQVEEDDRQTKMLEPIDLGEYEDSNEDAKTYKTAKVEEEAAKEEQQEEATESKAPVVAQRSQPQDSEQQQQQEQQRRELTSGEESSPTAAAAATTTVVEQTPLSSAISNSVRWIEEIRRSVGRPKTYGASNTLRSDENIPLAALIILHCVNSFKDENRSVFLHDFILMLHQDVVKETRLVSAWVDILLHVMYDVLLALTRDRDIVAQDILSDPHSTFEDEGGEDWTDAEKRDFVLKKFNDDDKDVFETVVDELTKAVYPQLEKCRKSYAYADAAQVQRDKLFALLTATIDEEGEEHEHPIPGDNDDDNDDLMYGADSQHNGRMPLSTSAFLLELNWAVQELITMAADDLQRTISTHAVVCGSLCDALSIAASQTNSSTIASHNFHMELLLSDLESFWMRMTSRSGGYMQQSETPSPLLRLLLIEIFKIAFRRINANILNNALQQQQTTTTTAAQPGSSSAKAGSTPTTAAASSPSGGGAVRLRTAREALELKKTITALEQWMRDKQLYYCCRAELLQLRQLCDLLILPKRVFMEEQARRDICGCLPNAVVYAVLRSYKPNARETEIDEVSDDLLTQLEKKIMSSAPATGGAGSSSSPGRGKSGAASANTAATGFAIPVFTAPPVSSFSVIPFVVELIIEAHNLETSLPSREERDVADAPTDASAVNPDAEKARRKMNRTSLNGLRTAQYNEPFASTNAVKFAGVYESDAYGGSAAAGPLAATARNALDWDANRHYYTASAGAQKKNTKPAEGGRGSATTAPTPSSGKNATQEHIVEQREFTKQLPKEVAKPNEKVFFM